MTKTSLILVNKNSGFTLIEVLVYLALFALVIGGGMLAVYQIIESTNKTNENVVIQEDAYFLLQKISWALNGVKVTDVTVTSVELDINSGALVFVFDPVNENLTLNSDELNSSFVKIGAVAGKVFDINGNKLDISFKVNDQEFYATKYLQ